MKHMTISEIAEITPRAMYDGILDDEYSIRDFSLWVAAQNIVSYDEGFGSGFGGYSNIVQDFMEGDL